MRRERDSRTYRGDFFLKGGDYRGLEVEEVNVPHENKCWQSSDFRQLLVEHLIRLFILVGWSITEHHQDVHLVGQPSDPYPQGLKTFLLLKELLSFYKGYIQYLIYHLYCFLSYRN